MKPIFRTVLLLGSTAACTWAQPSIAAGGIRNAASYADPNLPSGSIAQGSLFVIFGQRLGPATITLGSGLPLQTSVAGTSIRFTPVAGGAAVEAFVYYTLAGQVGGILPSTAAPGDYNVTVNFSGQTSAPVRTRVVRSAPGIFARNQAGSGPAVVQNFVSQESQPVNGFTQAANPGQFMILWLTGLGPVTGGDNVAPPVGNVVSDLEVLVGNTVVRPTYAGRAPGFPGTDQVNFQLPENLPDGCFIPLAVRTGGVTSNFTTFAKATGKRTCDHPMGLSEATLTRLETPGATAAVGVFSLASLSFSVSGFDLGVESAGGGFARYDANSLSTVGGATLSNFLNVSAGTCTVFTTSIRIDPQDPSSGLPDTSATVPAATALDAGARLVLTGPGKSTNLEKAAGSYVADLPISGLPGLPGGSSGPFFTAGRWTLTGTGGADVGPFTASIDLAAPLNWTNRTAITALNRSQGLTVNWTGGGGANSFVVISGGSAVTSASDPTLMTIGAFTCTAPAAAGTFNVPTSTLSALPGPSDTGYVMLFGYSPQSSTQFTAPLVAGGNIDLGFLTYTAGAMTVVPVR